MAMRMLQQRMLSLLACNKPHVQESFWRILPLANAGGTGRSVLFERGSHFHTHLTSHTSQDVENDKADSSDPSSASNGISSNSLSETSTTVKYTVMSKLKTSSRHDLALVFTCKVCETRSVKLICRESYEKGVVVVRCGGCNNNHLIADRLGWFGEPGSIEELLASQGEEVKKGSIDSLNFTAEDLVGKKPQE